MKRAIAVSLPVCLLSGVSFFAVSSAWAQSDSEAVTESLTSVDTVVVTARRRPESLVDAPVAVSAFDSDRLVESSVDGLEDLTILSPSLFFAQGSGQRASSLRIRGFGTSGAVNGAEPAVGLFIDGVYRSRIGVAINELVDIDQVEVVRGAQGTLYGRNTTAGVIAIKTAEPEFDYGGFAEIEAGSLGLFSARGALTGPLIEDKAAFRLAASYTTRDGSVDDVASDRELNDRDRFLLRGQLLLTPNEEITWRIIGDYAERNEVCCAAVPSAYDPAVQPAYALLGGTTLASLDLDERETAVNSDFDDSSEDWGVSSDFSWERGDITLSSITAYRSFFNSTLSDGDFSDLDLITFGEPNVELDFFSQELRLSGETGPLSWTAGIFYFQEDFTLRQTQSFGSDTADFVNLSQFGCLPGTCTGLFFPSGLGTNEVQTSDFEQENEGWSVFGEAEIDLTTRLTLSGGARYSSEEKSIDADFTYTPGLDTAGGLFGPGPFVYGDGITSGFLGGGTAPFLNPYTRDREDEEWAYNVTLSADLTDNFLVYATYADAFKAGGFNFSAPANVGGGVVFTPALEFEPEFAENVELGLKTTLVQGRVLVSAALFRTEFDNLQQFAFDGATFSVINAGEAVSQGLELEVIAQPTDNLDLTIGMLLNDSEFDDFDTAPCPPGVTPDGATPGTCDASGEQLTGASDYSVNISGGYKQALSTEVEGFIRSDLSYRSEFNTNANFDPRSQQDGIVLLNAQAGVRMMDDDWSLSVWGRNLLNENYSVADITTSLTMSGLSTFLSEPRTYGVTLRTSF